MSQTSYDAGSIVASMDVDKSPFQAGLDQAKLDAQEFADSTYKAKLGVDTEQGDTDLDEFKSRLDEVGQASETAKVSVDDGDSTTKLDTLKGGLDEIGAKSETAKVAVDMGDDQAKIDLLKVDLDELGAKSVDVKVNVDAAAAMVELAAVTAEADAASGSTSGGGGGGFAGLSGVLSGLPDFLSPATAGIAVLATALIPLAGLATGVAIGLTGMAVAASAGIGAFGLAALPVLRQVSTAYSQITADQLALSRATTTAQQNTAITHLNDDLNNLSPTVRTITQGVLDFKQTFMNWDAQFSPDIINVFNAALGAAKPILDAITPLVHAGAAALTTFFNSMAQVASSQAFKDFINFLAAQAGPAIKIISQVIESFGGTFAKILEQSSPIIKDVEQGLLTLFNAFGKWVADGGFEKFVKWFQQNGAQIASDFLQIVKAVAQLIPLLLPVGELVLSFVTGLAQLITDVENFAGKWRTAWAAIREATDLATQFFESIPGRVNHVWSDVVNALHSAWSTVANWVSSNVVDPVVHFFESIPGGIAHVWSDVVNALHDAWSTVAGWVNTNVVQPVVQFFEGIPGFIAHVWSDVVSAIEGAWNAISGWVNTNVVQPVVGFFESIPGGIAHVWSDVVSAIEGAWNVVANWVSQNVIDPVVKFFTDMPGNITSALSGLAGVIEKPFQDAVGVISGIVNTVEGWLGDIGIHIGSTVSAASQAAATISALNPAGLIPNVPQHAMGTGMNTFQGITMVGEMGPELVNFGSPVQIIPNSAFSGLSGQSAINAGADFASFSGQGSSPMSVEINITIQNSGQSSTAEALTAATTQIVDELARELSATRIR